MSPAITLRRREDLRERKIQKRPGEIKSMFNEHHCFIVSCDGKTKTIVFRNWVMVWILCSFSSSPGFLCLEFKTLFSSLVAGEAFTGPRLKMCRIIGER